MTVNENINETLIDTTKGYYFCLEMDLKINIPKPCTNKFKETCNEYKDMLREVFKDNIVWNSREIRKSISRTFDNGFNEFNDISQWYECLKPLIISEHTHDKLTGIDENFEMYVKDCILENLKQIYYGMPFDGSLRGLKMNIMKYVINPLTDDVSVNEIVDEIEHMNENIMKFITKVKDMEWYIHNLALDFANESMRASVDGDVDVNTQDVVQDTTCDTSTNP